MCASEWSTSSLSTVAEARGDPGDSFMRCRSRNALRSISGSTIGRPVEASHYVGDVQLYTVHTIWPDLRLRFFIAVCLGTNRAPGIACLKLRSFRFIEPIRFLAMS